MPWRTPVRRDDVHQAAGEFRLRHGKSGARMLPTATVDPGIDTVAGNPWVIVRRMTGRRPKSPTVDRYRTRAPAILDDPRITRALPVRCPAIPTSGAHRATSSWHETRSGPNGPR